MNYWPDWWAVPHPPLSELAGGSQEVLKFNISVKFLCSNQQWSSHRWLKTSWWLSQRWWSREQPGRQSWSEPPQPWWRCVTPASPTQTVYCTGFDFIDPPNSFLYIRLCFDWSSRKMCLGMRRSHFQKFLILMTMHYLMTMNLRSSVT